MKQLVPQTGCGKAPKRAPRLGFPSLAGINLPHRRPYPLLRPTGNPLGGLPEFSNPVEPCSTDRGNWGFTMHMHTAIRAASFTQPPTQAKNLPLSNGRASADVIDLMGTVIPFARNTEVYGENEPAEYL